MAESHVSNSSSLFLDSEQFLFESLDFDTKKSVFTWSGSFEDLKSFCTRYLNVELASCSIATNETRKSIKTKSFTLNLFKTGTLQLQGSNSQGIKAELQSLLDAKKNTIQPVTDEPRLQTSRHFERSEGVLMQTAENHSHESDSHDAESDSDGDANELEEAGKDSPGEVNGISDLESEISKIWKSIFRLQSNSSYDMQNNHKSLTRELQKVRKENNSLTQELQTAKQDMSSLLLELETAKEERDSLRVVLSRQLYRVNSASTEEIGATTHSTSLASQSTAKPTRRVADKPINDEVVEIGSKSNTQENKGKRSKKSRKTSADKRANTSSQSSTRDNRSTQPRDNQHESSTRKPITVIAGDSIIQTVRGWQLSHSSKVVVKSFAGATTEDMEDHLKPLMRREPENIILHVGTNDLQTLDAPSIADGIYSLGRQIEENSPGTTITISGLLTRSDDELAHKVNEVNKALKIYCRQNSWGFIPNKNINKSYLNKGGLHLNNKGSNILSRNLTEHIDSN